MTHCSRVFEKFDFQLPWQIKFHEGIETHALFDIILNEVDTNEYKFISVLWLKFYFISNANES